jgi:CubicO group peptidase (beta-lactamase class C family)
VEKMDLSDHGEQLPEDRRMELDLTRDLEDLRVPGLSAAIVRRGEVICRAAAGLADTDRDKPVTPRTIFTWASVSKTVTATALMRLFDSGLFALDDAVNEYLPFAVRIPACPGRPVTFRHLLTHTSGIRDSRIYESSYVAGDSPVPLGEFLEEYLTAGGRYYRPKHNFRSCCPGTVSEYSNIGAGLVGHLVEVLSDEPFDRYAADHVFTPLGMKGTSFMLSDLDETARRWASRHTPTAPCAARRTSLRSSSSPICKAADSAVERSSVARPSGRSSHRRLRSIPLRA